MSQPGPADERQPPPKHHPATRDELFEYGRTYAIWEEEKQKRKPTKRVKEVDPDLQEFIQKWWVDPRIRADLLKRLWAEGEK